MKKLGLPTVEERIGMTAVFKVVKGVERIDRRSVCKEWESNKGAWRHLKWKYASRITRSILFQIEALNYGTLWTKILKYKKNKMNLFKDNFE